MAKKINPDTYCSFVNHFKELSKSDDSNESNLNYIINNSLRHADPDPFINRPFSASEVRSIIKGLSNHKAVGIDGLANEYFKTLLMFSSVTLMKIFNLVLDSGIIPKNWAVWIIRPILKSNGQTDNPDNYRGITILGCLGKCLLNARLNAYVENNAILAEDQTGFRQGYSTLDNIFTLKSIIDIYLSKKRRLYCGFIDFRKAFDKMNRTLLWQKLINLGINGKIIHIIHNIYKEAQSCLNLDGHLSEFFRCDTGLRLGENLSPLLFSLFLNDFNQYLDKKTNGLSYIHQLTKKDNNSTKLIVSLYALLCADDTHLLAETEHDLQNLFKVLYEYCNGNMLEVNLYKTKNIVFSSFISISMDSRLFKTESSLYMILISNKMYIKHI